MTNTVAQIACQSIGLRVKIYFKDGTERLTRITAFFFLGGEFQIYTQDAGDHAVSAIERIELW